MNSTLFTGSGAALVTPFADGKIDFDALGRLIDLQLTGGTDALVVCGTTGEPSTLTQAEKDAVLGFTLERADGRIPVIMGTGANCTAAAAAQSARAQKMGADGLLVVTPYYNKTTQPGLIAHFSAVADAVSIPVILYNVPSRTGVNLLPETAARLSEHKNILGIKEASGDITQCAELARLCGESMALYSGNDDQTLPMLALGAQGVISVAANIAPDRMHELTSSWFSGDAARSRALQLSLLPLIRQLFSEVNPIPVKAALEIMGVCRADVRLPLVRFSQEKWSALREEIIRLSLPV
ncbi:MAG: 4-hydroxy-tetrahydrodipicolinate synthase [Clostridia bacterium]|nr:4-hydroxy-tetrahydrodipicolinate synthase [Clostridia bacterium]